MSFIVPDFRGRAIAQPGPSLQPQEDKVHLEILPEVRVFRVVAVAKNHLAPEEIPVVVQLLFNVGQLSEKAHHFWPFWRRADFYLPQVVPLALKSKIVEIKGMYFSGCGNKGRQLQTLSLTDAEDFCLQRPKIVQKLWTIPTKEAKIWV